MNIFIKFKPFVVLFALFAVAAVALLMLASSTVYAGSCQSGDLSCGHWQGGGWIDPPEYDYSCIVEYDDDGSPIFDTCYFDPPAYFVDPYWVSNPACSDLQDNDGDGQIDSADALCHSEGNASNSSSYVSSKDTEAAVATGTCYCEEYRYSEPPAELCTSSQSNVELANTTEAYCDTLNSYPCSDVSGLTGSPGHGWGYQGCAWEQTCSADVGNSCQTGANSCDQRNYGTIQCNGICTVTTSPSDASCGVPTVSCSVSPTTAGIGEDVTWTATPSGGTNTYTSYLYYFDDYTAGGSSSYIRNYSSPGGHNASVTVTDSAGHTSVVTACSNLVTVTAPQCSDGINNDTDSFTDYPNDPGCTAVDDPTEDPNPAPQCSDGINNDSDAFIDYPNDPGCTSTTDPTEDPNPAPQCSDGANNDTDAFVDYPDDPGCTSTTDPTEDPNPAPQCSDGVNNDSDTFIDYPTDPGCTSATDPTEDPNPTWSCSDGIDNDGDGNTDIGDAGCHTDGDPNNPGTYDPNDPNENPQCSDGLDNDGDGRIDFSGGDPGCGSVNDGTETDGPPTVVLIATPRVVVAGSTSVLTWSSVGATSCSSLDFATGEAPQSPQSGVSVTPSQTTTYTITCTGSGGSGSSQVGVTVTPAELTLTATPQTLDSGEFSIIAWNPEGQVSNCTVSGPGIFSHQSSGSAQVRIDQESTYTFSCTSGGRII